MGDYDFVDAGADFAWVDDTPGYDFVDARINVVRLKHLQVKDVSRPLDARDVSTIYSCRLIVGG